MLDGLRVVIGSYLTILCCPSINFFVSTTDSTIEEGLISNENELLNFFFWQKKTNLRAYFFLKSDIIFFKKSEKADMLSSNTNVRKCQEGVVLCRNCV